MLFNTFGSQYSLWMYSNHRERFQYRKKGKQVKQINFGWVGIWRPPRTNLLLFFSVKIAKHPTDTFWTCCGSVPGLPWQLLRSSMLVSNSQSSWSTSWTFSSCPWTHQNQLKCWLLFVWESCFKKTNVLLQQNSCQYWVHQNSLPY